MSSFRKKSTSCTDATSSTSSTESTSSSDSSSCSDSESSSSDTESSSLEIEKGSNECKSNEIQQKLQVNTRCKSSEVKFSSKEAEKASTMLLMTKLRSSNVSHCSGIVNEVSSEDEVLVAKKHARLLNNINSGQRRKNTLNTVPVQYPQQSMGSGKAPPAIVKQHQQNFTVKAVNKVKTKRQGINIKEGDGITKDKTNCSSITSSENSDEELVTGKKFIKKPPTKNMGENKQASLAKRKSSMKRNISSKNSSRLRSSEDSNTESATTSVGESTFTSDSEPSETSNSSSSQTPKKTKLKRNSEPTSEELGEKKDIENRKITRSLSMRQGTKHFLNQCITETDSDIEADIGKYHFGKNKPKKGVTSNIVNKAKNKKDCIISKPRLQSPHATIEKKCPIEGCDSSGHLSGNQDKHFLAEACPIYHNMSASECKERASERKQRDEIRLKIGHQENIRKLLSPEQKEYKAKIRESRNSFRPMSTMNAEKIKVEKDCPDDDREPNLIGIAPDYDLQLFREAQAIASEKIEEEFKDLPVGKGIKYITMGKYKMKVWYQSPYPDDAARLPQMYICEFCLRYQKSETGIKRHAQKCVWRHPPGDEIYRKGKLQVWQVDGKRQKQYCQHLCLLAKFFLDHKTLYYDVEPFLFYIMTLADIDGCHTVGYFSKEKNSFYNVSCILTLPPYQRKGYGRLLIDFSYLLTRVEGKIGSPEKPLSDLGLISYRSYWKDVLLDFLCNRSGSTLSIKDVSQEMAIYSYDIVSTLQALGMMKYWKGKHIVLKKQDVLDEYEERVKRRGNFPKIDDTCLRWSPFIPSQSNVAT